jgi:hypothetical protein
MKTSNNKMLQLVGFSTYINVTNYLNRQSNNGRFALSSNDCNGTKRFRDIKRNIVVAERIMQINEEDTYSVHDDILKEMNTAKN